MRRRGVADLPLHGGRALFVAAWLLAFPGVVAASSLVDEVARAATSYHEEPARLDTLRTALEARAAASDDVPHLIAAARVNFLWAEVRAKTSDDKLAAYDRGRHHADRARQLAPKSAGAHFWFAVTSGRWAEAKGAWRALSTLRMLRQDPTYTGLRMGLAKVLLATGRRDEARAELRLVVAEKAPRNRAEWTLEHAPEAAKLLESQ